MESEDDVEMQLAALHGSQDENAAEFERALIKYATFSCRMLFVERVDTWNEFRAANAENCDQYSKYTAEQLCAHFLERVLPRVFDYELTAEQRQFFELLKLHPEFERNERGYRRVPPAQRTAHNRQPVVDRDFQLVTQPQNERQWFNVSPTPTSQPDVESETVAQKFELNQSRAATHTLVTTVPYEQQRAGYDFKFSPENAALISAALSNDFELSGCVLLDPREIHKRLIEAKRDFEQHAHMPANCMNAKELLEKIVKLKKLRESIVDVVSNCF